MSVSHDMSFLTQPQSMEQIHASIEGLRLPIGWARGSAGELYRLSHVRRDESWIKWLAAAHAP